MIIKKWKLSKFVTHVNTIESFIQLMEQEKECLSFMDLRYWSNAQRSSNRHLLSAVYRKPTHLDRYLISRSEHPIQQKQSIV